ncbi:hypothetical protein LZF95_01610 [Algoriphagus sp. AGSA1]|uniref:hypothetical protein n=1 Tax=Algoriphagus sp. AGSA1 TaxID=2907213 RepID=UPI001F2CDAE0|nr:hypothetical protein [Algoriphagus sp. AGSA1]MCE7053354.1 hypothetical protein [Algoriphagus sp. AGSA1]
MLEILFFQRANKVRHEAYLDNLEPSDSCKFVNSDYAESLRILLVRLTGFGYFIPILLASLTGYFLAPKTPFISSQKEIHPVQK